MLFGKIFTTFAALATTFGLYHHGILSGPSFSDRSIKTPGRVVDDVAIPGLNMRKLTVEFYANGTNMVRDMRFSRLSRFSDDPCIGDNVTLCYSPNDSEDIAVENGTLTCAPTDTITTVAVYLVYTLMFVAAFCAAFLAYSYAGIATWLLLSGALIYLVYLGISGDPAGALYLGLCLSPFPYVMSRNRPPS